VNGTATNTKCEHATFENTDPFVGNKKQCFCDDERSASTPSEIETIKEYWRQKKIQAELEEAERQRKKREEEEKKRKEEEEAAEAAELAKEKAEEEARKKKEEEDDAKIKTAQTELIKKINEAAKQEKEAMKAAGNAAGAAIKDKENKAKEAHLDKISASEEKCRADSRDAIANATATSVASLH
jgi:DNA repair exonuclease SbcCD ATPase subunit